MHMHLEHVQYEVKDQEQALYLVRLGSSEVPASL